MKMFKMFGKRGFAVLTSMALCAGLVLPSFAASFSDLNNAINGTYQGDAFSFDDGKITLKEDVVNTGGEDSITIGSDKNVTLDLAGWKVDYSEKGTGSTENNFKAFGDWLQRIEYRASDINDDLM